MNFIKVKGVLIIIFLLVSASLLCQDLTESELQRNQAAAKIYMQKDADKKEKLFKDWLQKYPPAKFSGSKVLYDYVKIELSKSYAGEENIGKALEYADKIETAYLRPEAWAVTAEALQKKNHLDAAATLYQKAREDAYQYKTNWKDHPGAAEVALKLTDYSLALSDVLYRQLKFTEALNYVKEAHDNSPEIRADIDIHYVNVLITLKKKDETFKIAEELVLEGLADKEMKAILRQSYILINGKTGADEYMKQVNGKIHVKKMKEFSGQMISLSAPEFSLNDLDGNEVSLTSLKGKIVVLDFWATWCIPCRESFPFMQMLLNKYKERSDINFLFIHTWERDEDATKKAKEFILENNYSFHVLMDLKDPITQVNKVVRAYNVSALPAKLIIDKQGNIRFYYQKLKGGTESEMDDIAAMIDLID